ncbi:MAG: SCO family protein [Gammaproteobacteria bacterium]|nr:SCO family protein [Gammaproteobacteria bacterium]MDH3767150.1 SCO family protein [Gammaproteobacteria bacterium]
MKRSVIPIVLAGLAAFAVGIAAGMLRKQPDSVSTATVFNTPRALPDVTLSDEHSTRLARARFLDGWDILFFGFTHCPDICPTTLYELGQLSELLDDLSAARQPRIWLVTVDPERDTPQVLEDYLSHFGPHFSGITGSADEIALFAAGLGVAYQRITKDADYTISHTAALFLVDPAANQVALFSAPHDMASIAADYRLLTR